MHYISSDAFLQSSFAYLHSSDAGTVTWVAFANDYILIKTVAQRGWWSCFPFKIAEYGLKY